MMTKNELRLTLDRSETAGKYLPDTPIPCMEAPGVHAKILHLFKFRL